MTCTPRKHCGWFWDLHTQMLHVWNIYQHLSILLYMEHLGHIWNTKKMFDCLLMNNVCFPTVDCLICGAFVVCTCSFRNHWNVAEHIMSYVTKQFLIICPLHFPCNPWLAIPSADHVMDWMGWGLLSLDKPFFVHFCCWENVKPAFFSALALPRHITQEVLENPLGIIWNYPICMKGTCTWSLKPCIWPASSSMAPCLSQFSQKTRPVNMSLPRSKELMPLIATLQWHFRSIFAYYSSSDEESLFHKWGYPQ